MNKIIVFLFFLIPFSSFAQINNIEDVDFRPPVDIPIYLSGTFGELRSNHFHSGIDIKTKGIEGKKVYAIGDGWISRIKISEGGYGKVIYITHYNGYVSVYGHLQRFNNDIQKLVIKEQYKKESFTIQVFPDKDEYKIKKSELIAYSGNTGSSHGPHLHFEIREEKSQFPVNPLLNKNIKIKDFYRPSISKLAIYPVDDSSSINGENDTLFLDVTGWGLEHRIKEKIKISVSGRISFGIGAIDRMNDISNKNGVYSTKLYYDTSLVFHLSMSSLSFSTTRFINSAIDYNYFTNNKERLIRTQIDTNNLLNNYVTVENNGIINFDDTLTHNLHYEVKDAYDNTSILKFAVISCINKIVPPTNHDTLNYTYFSFAKKNSIINDSLSAVFSSNSFYNSFYFYFKKLGKDSVSYSNTYKLHNRFTPVHKYFNIKMIPEYTTLEYQNKLFIAYSSDNEAYSYMGSKSIDNYVTAKSRKLGYYKIMIDTIPPIIEEINFYNGKKLGKQTNLKIKIADEQTGVLSYRAELNGNWILMEYDQKKSLLVYSFDERIKKGNNNFKLVVTDLLDNRSEYNCEITY